MCPLAAAMFCLLGLISALREAGFPSAVKFMRGSSYGFRVKGQRRFLLLFFYTKF